MNDDQQASRENDDAMAEGFALSLDEHSGGEQKESAESGATQGEQPFEDREPGVPSGDGESAERVQYGESVSPVQETYAMPEQHTQPVQADKPASIQNVPEHIAVEYERLKSFRPEAAELALEDSPDGAVIRDRLENYGAELALDRVDRVFAQRGKDSAAQQAHEQAVQQHNTHFFGTLQREVPEYHAMLTNPERQAEAQNYGGQIMGWIKTLTKAEGDRLEQIALYSQDPAQVAGLIKQFEASKAKPVAKKDPTGALAVPTRGAAMPPVGLGDKDDFDAGVQLSINHKR